MEIKVLFLDIDGVLNDHHPMSNHYCSIKHECVECFNKILSNHMDLKIVISSAWRYLIIKGSMTLKGFEQMMLTHGLECHNRFIGHTEVDTEQVQRREDQILNYVASQNIKNYVVLDDLPLELEKRFIRTDGNIGLTEFKAMQVINLLKEKIHD